MERPDAVNNGANLPPSAGDAMPPPPPNLSINATGSELDGRSQPNTIVRVYNPAGTIVGTGVADEWGFVIVYLSPAQLNGEELITIATDPITQLSSAPSTVTAPDLTAPDAPSGNFNEDYTAIEGMAQPWSRVSAKLPSGESLGETTADENGHFSITLLRILNPGEECTLEAVDMGGTSPKTPLTRPQDTDPCFLAGTMILTSQGEVAVQDLKVGDLILSREGEAVPVLWIGTRQVRTAQKRTVDLPVSIRAGALGEGLPHSDLRLSPDHAVVLDELLVNAGALHNGETVFSLSMQELGAEFTYYHIETRNHEEILANGLAVETFIDYVSRSAFDNYAEYLELHGADRIIKEMQRPRIASARNLPASLQDRLGLTPSRLEDDVDHLLSARAG